MELLLQTDVPDERRESSICFELKHSSAVTQFARLLARRRGLPVELCAAGGLLHDIYVIVDGGYAEHAVKGAPIAQAMAEEVGGFSEAEIQDLDSIIRHHSDKHLTSEDPFAEFGKDVDVLDCFLYPGAFEWYLANKPLPVFQHYLTRATRVWEELGVPADPGFDLLEDYEPSWLGDSIPVDPDAALPRSQISSHPPFLLLRGEDGWSAHFRGETWRRALADSREVRRHVGAAAAQALPGLASVEGAEAAMVWAAVGQVEVIETDRLDRRLGELLGRKAMDLYGARR
ncbi:MAG TPA: HD domain-containing protein [Solirubrobacterales bacterium]